MFALHLSLLQTCSFDDTVPLGSAPIGLVQSNSIESSSSDEQDTCSSAFQGELWPGRRVVSSLWKARVKQLNTLAVTLANSSWKQAQLLMLVMDKYSAFEADDPD